MGLALALAAIVSQGEVVTASPVLTVSEWKTRDERQRQILVVAAIEGLLLASAGQDGEISGVNGRCLSDTKLSDILERLPREEGASPLALSVMEVSGCSL
jgi:hypothetical protein